MLKYFRSRITILASFVNKRTGFAFKSKCEKGGFFLGYSKHRLNGNVKNEKIATLLNTTAIFL